MQVIIIGDENKISEKEGDKCKLKFKDFKEKTIGRTFEIKVNIEETLDFFIGEISANNRNLLSENKELIIKIFQASKFDNLRVPSAMSERLPQDNHGFAGIVS